MKALFCNWLKTLEANTSIRLLTQSTNVTICLEQGGETYYLKIANGEIKQVFDPITPEIIIKGSQASFLSLLNGTCLLRKLVTEKKLHLHATYRNSLFMETLFHLAHPKFLSEVSGNRT